MCSLKANKFAVRFPPRAKAEDGDSSVSGGSLDGVQKIMGDYLIETEIRGLDTTPILSPVFGSQDALPSMPAILMVDEEPSPSDDIHQILSPALYQRLKKLLGQLYTAASKMRSESNHPNNWIKKGITKDDILILHDRIAEIVFELVVRNHRTDPAQESVTLSDLLKAGYQREDGQPLPMHPLKSAESLPELVPALEAEEPDIDGDSEFDDIPF